MTTTSNHFQVKIKEHINIEKYYFSTFLVKKKKTTKGTEKRGSKK